MFLCNALDMPPTIQGPFQAGISNMRLPPYSSALGQRYSWHDKWRDSSPEVYDFSHALDQYR